MMYEKLFAGLGRTNSHSKRNFENYKLSNDNSKGTCLAKKNNHKIRKVKKQEEGFLSATSLVLLILCD